MLNIQKGLLTLESGQQYLEMILKYVRYFNYYLVQERK